ncbi:MAG TPA: BTAD domain-containing putative transcriptional regulator, partial [Gemmatimonadales bacterium]|nr:BTAD domain-containing putative transcriptional regulator [Gemmatimonadales bacterium]
MFRLLTLGRLDLTDPHGREVRSVLSQPKRLALLSYLALANSTRFRRRDSVLSLFWPELDTSHARASLRQALTFLRRSLAEGVILTRGEEEIGVDPSLLWCDAVAFDSACEGNPEEAIRLYHGPFLPGLFVDGAAPELDAWIDAERGRRQRAAVEQAQSAAERARARGDLATALQRAQLAVSLSPGEESSVARLIELLDQSGDRARALAEYEAFALRLREELDTEPAPETQALIQAVRGRTALPPGTRAIDPPAVETAPGEPTALAVGLRLGNRRWLLGAGGLLAAGLMSLQALRFSGGSSRESAPGYDPNVIAVAPFDVFAPERGFWREGMTDLLSPLLDGAGPLRTIPVRQVLLHWKGRAERESAVELAQATGAGVVVYGRLLWPEPDSIRVLITLLDLGSGEAVDLEVKDLADRIDRAAESLALRVLRQLGETRPVAAVRGGGMGSRSFPALKAFLQGEQYYRRGQPDSALRYFERAITLDTLFALAWWRRMGTLAMLGPVNDSVVLASGLKAGALNHGLSPRDSLMVVADSIGSVMSRQSGDTLYAAHQVRLHATLEELTRRYPEDAEAWFLLGQARLTGPMGMSLDQTLDAIDRAIRLDSSFLPAWMRHQPVELALRLGEVERARRHLRAKAGGKARPQEVDGYRFAALMLERPGKGYRMLDGWADTAGIRAIVAAIAALTWWPDTGEAAVRLTRVLTRRSRAADTADAGLFPAAVWRISGSVALLARGHLREAWSLNPYFVSRMAARFAGAASFAALPAESAAALQPIQGA